MRRTCLACVVLAASVTLAGCGHLGLATRPWASPASILVTNGIAFDRAVLDLGSHQTVVLPESAAVKENSGKGRIVILMQKGLGFGGHPPLGMSPSTARHYMGCASRVEDGKLLLGTYGEWNSHIEGGARLRMTVLVPTGVKAEKEPELSGEGSRASRKGDPGLGVIFWGYWYTSGRPAEGWKRIASSPDFESARNYKPQNAL